MKDAMTTVNVPNVPVAMLELLREDAVRAMMTNTYAGILRYALKTVADAKAASMATEQATEQAEGGNGQAVA